ncbi:hemerythrin domain-containing protein [Paenibacillus roseipurpureus]|uniref:Hemerythrin domain-containing protein n=1 Tax=Paenibacillus roseopurpureus TaxID=2918901 RepID=A0AA96LLP7_9BACL|nr:hemerythrin domain-containing protein [Paenibacillus sp. MBLB1832]WNR44222.1 hemerythrin domain-containing protein [Paenibacillus sp. MBLB1832]
MSTDLGYSIDEATASQVGRLLKRLKDEHGTLKSELDHIQEQTGHMADLPGTEASKKLLQDIRQEMEGLLEKLEAYEQWEEDEVFPILYKYTAQGPDPAFLTSAWVLEEDHKQVERFVRSFIAYANECDQGANSKVNVNIQLKKAISLLRMACAVMAEQLLTEEEMVFPLADEILGNYPTFGIFQRGNSHNDKYRADRQHL